MWNCEYMNHPWDNFLKGDLSYFIPSHSSILDLVRGWYILQGRGLSAGEKRGFLPAGFLWQTDHPKGGLFGFVASVGLPHFGYETDERCSLWKRFGRCGMFFCEALIRYSITVKQTKIFKKLLTLWFFGDILHLVQTQWSGIVSKGFSFRETSVGARRWRGFVELTAERLSWKCK